MTAMTLAKNCRPAGLGSVVRFAALPGAGRVAGV